MVLFASRQWNATQDFVFQRINTAIVAGKLCLGVGTVKVLVWWVGERHYLPWLSSRSESSYIGDRIGTQEMSPVPISHSVVLAFSTSRQTLQVWCVAPSWTEKECL